MAEKICQSRNASTQHALGILYRDGLGVVKIIKRQWHGIKSP